MSKSIVPFEFEGEQVRVVEDNFGDPWWVVKDVCWVLEISNPRNVMARMDEDEKGVHKIDTPGGKQDMTIVNESGLYALILRSRKPQARKFRKWITSEVLPAIRTQGRYEMPEAPPVHQPGPGVDELERRIKILEARMNPGHEPIVNPTIVKHAAKLFRQYVSVAKNAGMSQREANAWADNAAKNDTGYSPLNLMGIAHLVTDSNAINRLPV